MDNLRNTCTIVVRKLNRNSLGCMNTSCMRQDHTKIVLKAVGYEDLE